VNSRVRILEMLVEEHRSAETQCSINDGCTVSGANVVPGIDATATGNAPCHSTRLRIQGCLGSNEPYGPAHGARPVQGALWTAQHFYPINVIELRRRIAATGVSST
jgi:hypothetical protein